MTRVGRAIRGTVPAMLFGGLLAASSAATAADMAYLDIYYIADSTLEFDFDVAPALGRRRRRIARMFDNEGRVVLLGRAREPHLGVRHLQASERRKPTVLLAKEYHIPLPVAIHK